MRWSAIWIRAGLVTAVAAVAYGAPGGARLAFGPGITVPPQQVPAGVADLTAEACKPCHLEIYEQWRASMHSKAAGDPVWRTCWTALNRPPFCSNCHFPMASQKPMVLRGFKETGPLPFVMLENPRFQPALVKEGVTCAVCHIRNGTILGPRELKEGEAPHPTQYEESLTKSEFCFGCHGWRFPRSRLEANCDTVEEYQDLAGEDQRSCQDCHMPRRLGLAADGGPEREYGDHTSLSAHRGDEIASALKFEMSAQETMGRPGDPVKAEIIIANTGAAHRVPSGCGARALHLRIGLVDAAGEWHRTQVYRISRAVEFPAYPSETHDTRLEPGEQRTFPYHTHLPGTPSGPWVLRAELTYYLLSPKKAEEAPLDLSGLTIPVAAAEQPLGQWTEACEGLEHHHKEGRQWPSMSKSKIRWLWSSHDGGPCLGGPWPFSSSH